MCDFLTENPEAAASNFGPGRKITSMYKGLTKEERENNRLNLLAQIEAKKERKIYEERLENEWLLATKSMHASIAYRDDDLRRKKLYVVIR